MRYKTVRPSKEWLTVYSYGPNPLTPDIIEYRYSDSRIVELSEGTDMIGKPLYGVTVIEQQLDYSWQPSELSRAFNKLDRARAYIKWVLKGTVGEWEGEE